MFRTLYEGLVGGLANLLENSPREEVVTRTDMSGAVENPQTSTLPGFKKELASHRSS